MTFDLTPATRRLAELVRAVDDEQLDHPTPCSGYAVGDLLDHIAGFALGFTEAAEKSGDPGAGGPPQGSAANLAPAWRTRIPEQLGTMAEAWQDPAAWTGMTSAGGIELPGEVAPVVALEELVVHGWDLAAATGQPFDVPDEELAVVEGFFESFPAEARGDAYAAAVEPGGAASRLDRAIAESGRDPAWTP